MVDSIWMLHGNNLVDLLNPDPRKMNQQIISNQLQNIRRFRDHEMALNVLEHVCLVEALATHLGESEAVQFWGRHHDDHEAFIGDIHSALKFMIRQKTSVLDDITNRIDRAICKLHGKPYPKHGIRHTVNDLDKFTRHWEWVHIMEQSPDSPGAPELPDLEKLKNIPYDTMMKLTSNVRTTVRVNQENRK